MSAPDRSLARLNDFDVMIEDHGCLTMAGHFDYEDGGSQGFGYFIDAAFIVRLLRAVGVSAVRDLNGRSAWVTHTWTAILRVEPLHAKDGRAFDIPEWQSWHKRRMTPITPHELATGEAPR